MVGREKIGNKFRWGKQNVFRKSDILTTKDDNKSNMRKANEIISFIGNS